METDTAWHLVLSRDGTVMAATDGACASWVGTRLDDLGDAPEELKDHSSSIATQVSVKSVDHPVHLTVADALPLRRGPTDLRALLKSTLEVLQRQARAFDVTLKIVVDQDVPANVALDAEKIAWATTALVGNDLRYVHHGSMVMPGGTITVRVSYRAANPEVVIEVEDDGSGIPADKLPMLFSVKPGQPRMGLGLAMVREVVAAHSGSLEVQSETQSFRSGTTIRMTLPI
jgi:signal transduction histidine kinase